LHRQREDGKPNCRKQRDASNGEPHIHCALLAPGQLGEISGPTTNKSQSRERRQMREP
jgi:hypothetical protein